MKTFYAAAAIAISVFTSQAHAASDRLSWAGQLGSSNVSLFTSIEVSFVGFLPTREQDNYVWSEYRLDLFPLFEGQFDLTFFSSNASATDNPVIKFSTEIMETGAPSPFTLASKPTAQISYDFGPGITSHEEASVVSIGLPTGQSTISLRLTDHTLGVYTSTCSEPEPYCFPGTLLDRGALVMRFSVGTPVPVPEPSSFALMGTGLALIGLARQRRLST